MLLAPARSIDPRSPEVLQRAVEAQKPFLAVVWFHTPHLPVVAGPQYLKQYPESGRAAAYYGCLTAMDEQIGRLRATLHELDVAANTMLWFCSDNGPEGTAQAPGRTRGLRGRKRSLYEGGVRVPGLLEWPAEIRKPRSVSAPCSTLDYLPTILDLLDEPPPDRPLDGISLLPLIRGKTTERKRAIPFESRNRAALVTDRFKLVVDLRDKSRAELKRTARSVCTAVGTARQAARGARGLETLMPPEQLRRGLWSEPPAGRIQVN